MDDIVTAAHNKPNEYQTNWSERFEVLVRQEPVVGHRIWRLNRKGQLTAASGSYVWTPGSNVSKAPSCSEVSGFHSFIPLEHDELENIYRGKPRVVVGAIVGAGEVELYPAGFRSEKAQVVALYAPDFLSKRKRRRISSLGKQYRVPVFSDAKEFNEFSISHGEAFYSFDWERANAVYHSTLFNLDQNPKSLGNRFNTFSIGSANAHQLTMLAVIVVFIIFCLLMTCA